jgi:hypothetical protein
MSLSTSSCSGLVVPLLKKTPCVHHIISQRKPTLPGQYHLTTIIISSSLGGAAVLGATEDIIEEAFPNLPCHTLDLLDRLLQVPRDNCCHALEVNMVALCHV